MAIDLPKTFLDLGLEDIAVDGPIPFRPQILHLRQSRDSLDQLIQPLSSQAGDVNGGNIPAERLQLHTLRKERVLHFTLDTRSSTLVTSVSSRTTYDVSAGLVDLVDSHNDTDLLLVDQVDHLAGLRHDTIVGCDDKDDNVRHPCTASAHSRERGMSRSVQERDGASIIPNTAAGDGNGEGTDMLRNTTRLALGDGR